MRNLELEEMKSVSGGINLSYLDQSTFFRQNGGNGGFSPLVLETVFVTGSRTGGGSGFGGAAFAFGFGAEDSQFTQVGGQETEISEDFAREFQEMLDDIPETDAMEEAINEARITILEKDQEQDERCQALESLTNGFGIVGALGFAGLEIGGGGNLAGLAISTFGAVIGGIGAGAFGTAHASAGCGVPNF